MLESQVLAMRRHSAWLGQSFGCIRVTGGASQSEGLRQLIADIFQSTVETIQVANSAALGAAMRAAHAVDGLPLAILDGRFCRPTSIIEPDDAKRGQAEAMLEAFTAFEATAQQTT